MTAIRYTEDGLEEARKTQDIELMVPPAFALCTAYLQTSQYENIVHKIPEVIRLIEKTRRESEFFIITINPYSYICGQCGFALAILGRFEEGKAYLEKALHNATRVNDPATLGLTQLMYGYVFHVEGAWDSAKEHLKKAIAHSEEAKYQMGVAWALCILGNVHSHLGDPETGRRQADEGLRISLDSGIKLVLPFSYWAIGEVYLDLRDSDNARTFMEEALRLSRKNSEKGNEGLALVGLGRVLGKRQPPLTEQAEECFSKGISILQIQKMKPMLSCGRMYLGEFYLDTGDKKKAIENLKKAEGMFQEMGMDYWLNRTKEFLGKV